MTSQLQNPTNLERKLAREFIEILANIQAPLEFISDDRIIISLEHCDQPLAIPRRFFNLFVEIMKCLAAGNSIYVFQADFLITTQQAADILKISRPHLVKLLEKGEIPFIKAGVHRKILVADIYHYSQKMKQFIVKNDIGGNSGASQELAYDK